VLIFAGAVSALAAAFFSLTPAWRLSRSGMRAGLSESARGSAGLLWRRLGSKLVVVELATAVVLLVGAGLLGKSLYHLLNVNIGFQPDHLVAMEVTAPQSRYGDDEQAAGLARQVMNGIASLPGVTSVSVIANGLPVSHNGNTSWFRIWGRPWHGTHNEAPVRGISPDYFATLGAKLLRGRRFDESEDRSKPPVAIINETLARKYFPGEDPIGKQLGSFSDSRVPMEIVGLVEDLREGPLDAAIPPVIYVPFNQDNDNGFWVVVRTSQAEQALLPIMASTIRQIDFGIVTSDGATMNDRINDSMSAYLHRSSAVLVGGFAALALLLSVVGLYGVVAYSVSRRTREIGVRMALGAQRSSVHLLILKEAGGLAAVGIAAGLICSLAAATFMRSLLFGVNAWDLPTLIMVAAVLAVAALAASYLPARRAASVNPVEALRSE
jgi:predicted permease